MGSVSSYEKHKTFSFLLLTTFCLVGIKLAEDTGRRNKRHLIEHITKTLPFRTACEVLKNVEKAVMRSWELLWDRAVCFIYSYVLMPNVLLDRAEVQHVIHASGEPGSPRCEKECAAHPVLAEMGEQRKWTRWSSRLLFSKTCSLMDSPFIVMAKL